MASAISGLTETGVPVSVPLVRSIMIGVLRADGNVWCPSRSWVRSFLRDDMKLRWREATRPARHLPPNFDEVKERFLHRFVWTVARNQIKKQLTFNLDEAGVLLNSMTTTTWGKLGAKDVEVLASDEKTQVLGFFFYLVVHVFKSIK